MTIASDNLTLPQEQIDQFCARHHIRRLALFGSVLSEDFEADSDVDVLVEFEPGHVLGLAFFFHAGRVVSHSGT